MPIRPRALLLAVAAAFATLPPVPSGAQDVELLARVYGTPLPEAYLDLVTRQPDAFRFGRAAWSRGGDPARRSLPRAEAMRGSAPQAVIGPRDGPVVGDFLLPVVLGLYGDSPPGGVRYSRDDVWDAYFGDHDGTISAYYGEVSGGRVELVGDVRDWVRASVTQADATGGQSGLAAGTVGPFIKELLDGLPELDWGRYDNDGPDGVPNSGDDDGFVDVLAVIHPTPGGECGGSERDDRIWSHRWTLSAATSAGTGPTGPWVTPTPAAAGGFIRVDDYVVQPVFACNGVDLNEIGVFTHELGHAFGLPDLYDTRTRTHPSRHNGAGNWDLMATGSWGCDGHSPERPCHMGAWSKAALGWVDVATLPADADLGTIALAPVATSGVVHRVEAGDGSGEYFLLENRQRIGFDLALFAEGLLVWHVRPQLVSNRWPFNGVNGSDDMGVWLRQADGLDELGTPGGGRGDSGDPFPYTGLGGPNREFHAASRPAARSMLGTATGVTLLDIERLGDDIGVRVLTRFTRVTVRSEGDSGIGGLFRVNGVSVPELTHTFLSAPFEDHAVEALAGEPITAGVRRPFVGWDDDPSAPRVRVVDAPLEDVTYVARYQGRELELGMVVTGGMDGIEPGTFQTQPASEDLWFPEGTLVTVEAVPQRGFAFLRWSGALANQPNPATIALEEPVAAGAHFELTFTVPATTVSFPAAEEQEIRLEPEDGTSPYFWTVAEGMLPEGIRLDANGDLLGAALETGRFDVTLEVRDAIGLTTRGSVTLDVSRPAIPVDRLTSAFFGVGPPLDLTQMRFLDRQGNRDGGYDLGDFRAWVLSNPDLPLPAAARALARAPRTVVVPTAAFARPGGRR